jgi:hypothetical protein
MEADPRFWRRPVDEQAQAEWLEDYLPLLLAKPSVIAVFWNHLSDAQPHRFPHAGLVGPDGRAKPALARLTELHKTHWS